MFRIKPKKVLIVGGEGFIGKHLHMPHAYVCDIKSGWDFRDGLEYDYDTIVFLAADLGRDQKAYDYNSELFHSLDSYMIEHPNTHVVYTSSAAVYGDCRFATSELTPPRPVNLYGEAKLLGELHVQQYKRHTILRLANVYGEGGKGAIDLFKSGKKTIFGKGDQVRDYIFVDVVAMVIKRAVENPALFQGITNCGTGQGQTTKDIFKRYGSGRVRYVKAREGDVQYSVLDSRKLTRLLARPVQ